MPFCIYIFVILYLKKCKYIVLFHVFLCSCQLETYRSKCSVLEEENGILKTLINEGKEQVAKGNIELAKLQQAEEVRFKDVFFLCAIL